MRPAVMLYLSIVEVATATPLIVAAGSPAAANDVQQLSVAPADPQVSPPCWPVHEIESAHRPL